MIEVWLNDIIINNYIKLLIKNCNDNIFAFDSFFYQGVGNSRYTRYLNKTLKTSRHLITVKL